MYSTLQTYNVNVLVQYVHDCRIGTTGTMYMYMYMYVHAHVHITFDLVCNCNSNSNTCYIQL